MPNRVAPHGSTSGLAQALASAARGQQLFKRQMYTITNILADGDRVALEMDWIGITAVQIQNLPPNSEMRDHAAVFLHFREGRIARQRHYDCFEPW
jgi:ketosteroid isomerase-like protein